MSTKKLSKSRFRKINEWLHLWLGLLSGVVVFVVCLTAAIWVFRDEISYFTQPFNRVKVQHLPYQKPAVLKENVQLYLKDHLPSSVKLLNSIRYREDGKTVLIAYADSISNQYGQIHLNPYTGEIVHNESLENSNTRKFLIFIRAGHRFFWLPKEIGSPIVGISCIIFLITLITGLIWWYPRKWNKSTRDKSFKIKWNGNWKRVNLDLHNVLGFYSLLIAFILTYTGIYYTFNWFREGHHFLMTGNKKIEQYQKPEVDAGHTIARAAHVDDLLWERIHREIDLKKSNVYISYPEDTIQPYIVSYNPKVGTNYKIYNRYYDQRNLAELPSNRYDVKFKDLSLGQKIVRLNFDLHVATIGGLTTKIIAGLASLVGASLPITGFIIWYNRKWGKKKRKGKNNNLNAMVKKERFVETK